MGANGETVTVLKPQLKLILAAVIACMAMTAAPRVAMASGGGGLDEGGFVSDVLGGSHPLFEAVGFYLFGGLAAFSAIAICFTKDVVRMAIWLFATLGAVAILYFLLTAYFLGVIQIIVYAGGTLVLLIFGVMLTTKSPSMQFAVSKIGLAAGGVVSLLLFAALMGLVLGTDWQRGEPTGSIPVATLGRDLLTTYLVPFEVISVLLLVVMIGAAYLARQERE